MDALEALSKTGVWLIAPTTFPATHDFVCSPDDTSIQWCQWCGRHKVTIEDLGEDCDAMLAAREVMK